MKHFHKDDLVVGKQRITLKRDALPKIFNTSDAIVNASILPKVSINANDTSHANGGEQTIRVITNRKVISNHRNERELNRNIDPRSIQPIQPAQQAHCTDHKDIQSRHPLSANAARGTAIQFAQNTQNNGCGTCNELKNRNDILEAEYNLLREEFIDLEARKGIEITNLETEMKKLKFKTDIQKQELKYLSSKVYRKQKSEESLKLLLKDLEAQNVLSTKACETLAVSA